MLPPTRKMTRWLGIGAAVLTDSGLGCAVVCLTFIHDAVHSIKLHTFARVRIINRYLKEF